jgi:hypothetical protein
MTHSGGLDGLFAVFNLCFFSELEKSGSKYLKIREMGQKTGEKAFAGRKLTGIRDQG